MKGILYLGKVDGFDQRAYTATYQTPFLPVTQHLIKRDLKEYVLKSTARPKNEYLDIAIQRTFEMFLLEEKVKMYHLNDVFQKDLDIWTESPGLPWLDHGYKTKSDIKSDPDAVQSVRRFAHFIKEGADIKFPDCVAYVRSHTSDEGEYKVRVVWDYPATVTFVEAIFALPLIEGYQRMRPEIRPIAYGFEIATEGKKLLTKRFTHDQAYFTGIDFKKFDKTVPPWLIDIAFDILMININFVHYQDHGVADIRRMILLFYTLKSYFVNTKIRTADGCRYKKFSGIASGSYFTQLVGSIVNMVLILWMSLEQFSCFPLDVITLGDDSFISSSRKWNLKWCSEFVKRIGMEINIDESDQSENLNDIKFLGHEIGEANQ